MMRQASQKSDICLLPAPGMLGLGIAAAPSCGFITPGGRSPTGGPGGG